MKIAVIGATCQVGKNIVEDLMSKQKDLDIDEIIISACDFSSGTNIEIKDRSFELLSIGEILKQKPDYALFAIQSQDICKGIAPRFEAEDIPIVSIDKASEFFDEKMRK